ncbi:hypothetical protein ANO11243_092700 [Dothideomycetidae sp. 11243]|nr:hypothetical protein ANO11243_092700 [fungal sp. No.11243]
MKIPSFYSAAAVLLATNVTAGLVPTTSHNLTARDAEYQVRFAVKEQGGGKHAAYGGCIVKVSDALGGKIKTGIKGWCEEAKEECPIQGSQLGLDVVYGDGKGHPKSTSKWTKGLIKMVSDKFAGEDKVAWDAAAARKEDI